MKLKKKINVHIYPSDMQNEARIQKITSSINQLEYFDHIYHLGIQKNSLSTEFEKVSKNITIVRLPIDSQKWSNRRFVGKVLLILKFWILSYKFLSINKPEIINAHNLASLPPSIFFKILNRKSKIVYDTHELETERQGSGTFERYVTKIFEYVLIRFVDKVVVVNDIIGDWYKKKYSISPIVINNVPHYRARKSSNYLLKKFNIKADVKKFIYIGALLPDRGIQKYLELFENTDLNICIIFLGSGPLEGLIKKYEERCKNIFFHPAVPYKEVVNIVSSGDFTVTTLRTKKKYSLSYESALPNKLFESIMSEIPILSGGMKYEADFIRKNEIGYEIITSDSQEEFELSVKNILSLDYEKMQENCRKIAKEYNWEQQEIKIKKYITNLIN
tara:strand:- start:3589 stop:4755 length:1167 start_codon:yes stop_codon:yes gene_type:complete